MTSLTRIPGIAQSSLELLEAAGFSDLETLAKAGVEELAAEIARANTMLQIAKFAPARDSVAEWISAARKLMGAALEAETEAQMPVNYELEPRVAAMLEHAAFAIPLPVKVLIDQRVTVSDIPPAILLNRYPGELNVRAEERMPALKNPRPAVQASHVKIADTSGNRLEIDASRIKSTAVLAGVAPRPESGSEVVQDDRVALIRGPLARTNEGRDPQSRSFIRGVLHSHPVALRFGAIVTLILTFLLPLAILSAGLLLISDQLPRYFGWVPKWLLVMPLALPPVAVGWLIWGMSGSCRICGQKMFVPRMCLKNSKAHHVPGLGHIVPTAVHMLVFNWFRCIYCGTPVRLKK